jgi:hypothetical protein
VHELAAELRREAILPGLWQELATELADERRDDLRNIFCNVLLCTATLSTFKSSKPKHAHTYALRAAV